MAEKDPVKKYTEMTKEEREKLFSEMTKPVPQAGDNPYLKTA